METKPEKIDLNEADAETLDALPGIGPALAQRIVAYRETVHPFEEVIELVAVPGISERMVRELQDHVAVTSPADLELREEEVDAEEPESVAEPAIILEEEAITSAESPVPVIESPAVTYVGPRLGALLLSGLLGGLMGAVMTLLVLGLVNGTLAFASAGRVNALEQQAITVHQDQMELSSGLGTLANRINRLSNRLDTVADQQGEAGQALTQTQTDVANLQGAALELDQRIKDVAEAADSFNSFLNALRDLLFDLQGPPPTPTATTTATATVTATPEATLTGTPVETVTATVTPSSATRTPRPTATPLPLPTSTPAP